MRLFIALALPPALLPLMKEAGAVFFAHADKISLTRVENLHLTLRFLGEVQAARMPGLRAFFRGLPGFPPGEGRVALSHYGSFPASDGLTLWAGLSCDQAVMALACCQHISLILALREEGV